MLKTIGATLVAGLVLTAGAVASQQGETYNLVANLKARNEVPKPAGVSTSAVGLFTAKAVEQSNGGAKITWRLTFSHLTGAATAAHIHLGKVGVAGPVAVGLCGPCKSGAKGTAMATAAQWKAIESGGAYANVHTAKNPNGEIRGQIKSSEGGTSSSSSNDGYGSAP
jgi:hypothetical protein